MPMTAFIGVRISWLMAARKADLAVVADSAWSRAVAIVRTARLTAVAIWAISRGPETRAGSLESPSSIRDAAAVTRSTGTVTRRSTMMPTPARTRALTSTRPVMTSRAIIAWASLAVIRTSRSRCSSVSIRSSTASTWAVPCAPRPRATTAWAASKPSVRRRSATSSSSASRSSSSGSRSARWATCSGLSAVSRSSERTLASSAGRAAP